MKKRYYARRRRKRRIATTRFYIIIGTLVVALAAGIFLIVKATTNEPGISDNPSDLVELTPPKAEDIPKPTDTVTAPTEEPTPTPKPSLSAELILQAVDETQPSKHGFTTKLMVDGVEKDSYQRSENITFGTGDEYTDLEGIITFRGNNYRNAPSYGTADITEESLELMRKKETNRIGSWGGSGWTGQPLIVKWPKETRENMTMLKEEFRTKEDFVEVIIASLDGNIYFMDLETGDKTRDFIEIGAPTKGTASLDPRGYPIIYVGQGLQPSGDASDCKDMYFRAYSLIDGELLMKFGAPSEDPFALRGWQAYDSSALIDAETDTLIAPGENGVLYTCELNTKYDEEAGTVSMDMDPVKVKYRYTSPRNEAADNNGRWGIENSIVTWREYAIFTDNAGMLQCVNMNTMEVVYVNDLTDDSDVSMVLEEDPENSTFYLYTGCEYDENVRKNGNKGTAYARKINGLTGEIIWQKEYSVKSGSVDGGILASPVLGKGSMEGLIIYNVSQEVKGNSTTSRLIAMDKNTGEEKWTYDMDISGWSPSSPVPVYTAEGKGYIVQCDRDGEVALIDGATGEAVSVLDLKVKNDNGEVIEQNNFEATPAVYGNTIVIGSRSNRIFFIKIK